MNDASADFGADPTDVGQARSFAASTLDGWGLQDDGVILVVGELAANASRHGRGAGFSVSIGLADGVVTVEVADEGAGTPVLRRPTPGYTGGRGLLIVDRLARSWGTRTGAGPGKTVWAEIQLRH